MEAEVYKWFTKQYPKGPEWTSKKFHCYRDAPMELRMIISMDKLEAEITNGGLPQFLWNTFFHWKHVLDDCENGYDAIGAIVQRDAVREFRGICERHQRECWQYISHCTNAEDFSYFSKWCEHGKVLMKPENEELFWADSTLVARKAQWLAKNREHLLELMAS